MDQPLRAYPAAPAVPWHRRLRTRLTLWIGLSSVALLLSATLASYLGTRQTLVANARSEIRNLTEQTGLALESSLDGALVAARTLAANVRTVGHDETQLRGLLRATVASDPQLDGAKLILLPGALAVDEPGFDWHIRRVDGGMREQPLQAPGFDYRNQPWWTRASESAAPWWSDPYANASTGEQTITTLNLPLRTDGGELQGLLSLDIALVRLQSLMQSLPSGSGMRSALVSPDGMFAVHLDPAVMQRQTLQQFVEGRRADLAPMLKAHREAMLLSFEHVDPDGNEWLSLVRPLGESGWTLLLSTSRRLVLSDLSRITALTIGIGALTIAMALLLTAVIARQITQPLSALSAAAGHFAIGEFDWPLPQTGGDDEVGLAAQAMERARESIKHQMDEIEAMSTARQKLESELAIAQAIQQSMLPPPTLQADDELPEVQLRAVLESAEAVGGDFYAWGRRQDARCLWFAVGDVSDKGAPAALFMARTISVLEVAAERGGAPEHVLRAAARRLAPRNDADMFATVLFGVFDPATGDLALASAGHDPPLLRQSDGRSGFLPVVSGPPLGLYPELDLLGWQGQLQPGDTLVVYTDGVTEAFDRAGRAFGEERLQRAVAPPHPDADAIAGAILQAVHDFSGGALPLDDVTLLVLRWSGRADEAGMGSGE